MRRWLYLVPVVVLLSILGGVGLFRVRPPAELGKPAAPFELPSVREPSETISLEDIVGRPVVINFWASWCDPCKWEAPELKRAAKRFGDEVTFLGVSMLDGPGPARRYMERDAIPYESVSDVRGSITKRYGVTGVPETVFLDAEGTVVGKYIGALRKGELTELVAQLVEAEPGELLEISGRGETRPVP